MQRRTFLTTLSSGFLLTLADIREVLAFSRPKTRFLHGIASGDPVTTGVIIWTRVSTAEPNAVSVTWEVAGDEDMRNVVRKGAVSTDASRDYTVNVDVSGLEPDEHYYYRFTCNRQKSVVGKTRTLPEGEVDKLKFAVVSCSNYAAGYFNAYRDIANRGDLDAVLHLGDYIYEYGLGGFATENAKELGRIPDPVSEAKTLSDYRRRHAQYKSDPDAQAMHAAIPFIGIWDDHEIANDGWRGGAENHQPDEGVWPDRRDAALQAYFEWMPIRGQANGAKTKIFRDFRWGNLASLIMLDTRLFGRDIQPNVGENVSNESIGEALRDPGRRVLGEEQEAWFRNRLSKAEGTTWQVAGQQVMVARMEPPDLEPLVDKTGPSYFGPEQLEAVIAASKSHFPQILDVWDGYPAAKEEFLGDLGANAKNPIVLSGDLHTAMAADLRRASGGAPVAVELMTTAVTSPGLSAYFPDKSPNSVRDGTLEQNPALRFLDIRDRGWLCVTLTHERCTGEWHLLDTIQSRDYTSRLAKTLSVDAGKISEGLF